MPSKNDGIFNQLKERLIKPAGPPVGNESSCPSCGGKIISTDKFCTKCGSKIYFEPVSVKESGSTSVSQTFQNCPDCGKQVPGIAKFCTMCGTKLASTPQAVPSPEPSPVQDTVSTDTRETAVGNAAPETMWIDAASVETTMLRLEDDKVPVLESVSGDEIIRVDKIEFVLGRNTEKCNYTFLETVIGREHAKIISIGGCYYIMDLGSKNSTYINDQRIESNINCELKENDRVKFANKEFIFKIT